MTSFTTLTPHASLDIDLDRFLELVRADMVGNMKGLTGANSSGNEKGMSALFLSAYLYMRPVH